MPSSTPDLILVPGAGLSQSSLRFLRDALQSRGHKVHNPTLPCVNCEPPTKTLLDDIDTIKSTIESLAKEGRDVVVVAHSAGAIPSSGAICGLEKSGDKAGVTGFIMMSGMALPRGGVSVREVFGTPPFEVVQDGYSRVPPEFIRKFFFSDIFDDLADPEIAGIKHMPEGFWATKLPAVPWTEKDTTIPIAYISYTDDQVFSPDKQSLFYSNIPNVKVKEVSGGHMGPMSQPEETAKAIDEIVKAL